jgi:hypothetical protein
MMDSSHERQSMGSSAGVCNGVGQPGTAAAERVPGCGEPDSPRTPASAAAPVGSGALHACRDRQATRTQSSGEGRLCGQTRHHSRLVSAAYRPQVRWFAILYLSWPTPHQSRDRGSGGSLRPRELGLGLRPHCRRAGEPRPSCFGPDCRQHPAPPRHRTGSQKESDDDLEGVHPSAYGRASRNRFLHGRGADVARLGDVLRSVFPASGDSTRKLGGHHAASHRGVDDADGPQWGRRGIWISAPPSLCAARPRHQVLR